MRALTIVMVTAVLLLAACQTQPLFPENESASMENHTNTTPIDNGHDDTDMTDDTDMADDTDTEDMAPEDAMDDEQYAASITATEGDLVRLNTRAQDPDGDDVELTFGEPFDEDGEWQTEVGDAGRYEVTVVASDGQAETGALVLVVIEKANSAPVISGPAEIEVREGETVDLTVFTIVDPDEDEFITSYAGWMSSSEYTTTYDDAGTHTVTIIAEDTEGNAAAADVTIVVENTNRRPRLDIDDTSVTATEGALVVIDPSVSDPDGDDVTVSFDQPFDEDGEWLTRVGDAGEYSIEVVASDGMSEITRTVEVTIVPANSAPTIDIDPVIEVDEGDTIDLSDLADIEDPDGDDFTVEYSGWMDEAVYTTTFDDAGEYEVTITAIDDNDNERSYTVAIIVNNVNRAPVFTRPA